ncbi:c-type cytochrome [Paracoccus sphaerophysae]|uniref:c-type cytochrome n=1 Tax=Paracoccus sphaerophysae TaxID=690417 RepID=UPI00068AC353|nr:c-type cytochrome [Paracoccus sphaerophysae]
MRPAIPAALLAAALLAGWTETDTRAPDSIAAGASDYAQRCVACHGPQGRGNGPAAAGMNPPVADLSLMARKNGGSFPWLGAMEQIDGHTMGASDSHMPA